MILQCCLIYQLLRYGNSWLDFNGVNQIDELLYNLKHHRYDRRHIITAWNPKGMQDLTLPPCHFLYQFYVDQTVASFDHARYGPNDNDTSDTLSMIMYSRSGDWMVGVPSDMVFGATMLAHISALVNLKPGTPNHPERIEGGLLSYGNDMDLRDNPFECGFDKYVDLESDIVFLGKENLKKIKTNGVKRKLMGLKIEAKTISFTNWLPIVDDQNNDIGQLRSAAYSPKFKKIVGIAMIKKEFCEDGKKIQIKLNTNLAKGEVCNFPIK